MPSTNTNYKNNLRISSRKFTRLNKKRKRKNKTEHWKGKFSSSNQVRTSHKDKLIKLKGSRLRIHSNIRRYSTSESGNQLARTQTI
jgi:hypothetical protein